MCNDDNEAGNDAENELTNGEISWIDGVQTQIQSHTCI